MPTGPTVTAPSSISHALFAARSTHAFAVTVHGVPETSALPSPPPV
ncbi:hypothetical protein ACFQV8_20170 [Pseudonocardia benzenivorans]